MRHFKKKIKQLTETFEYVGDIQLLPIVQAGNVLGFQLDAISQTNQRIRSSMVILKAVLV